MRESKGQRGRGGGVLWLSKRPLSNSCILKVCWEWPLNRTGACWAMWNSFNRKAEEVAGRRAAGGGSLRCLLSRKAVTPPSPRCRRRLLLFCLFFFFVLIFFLSSAWSFSVPYRTSVANVSGFLTCRDSVHAPPEIWVTPMHRMTKDQQRVERGGWGDGRGTKKKGLLRNSDSKVKKWRVVCACTEHVRACACVCRRVKSNRASASPRSPPSVTFLSLIYHHVARERGKKNGGGGCCGNLKPPPPAD